MNRIAFFNVLAVCAISVFSISGCYRMIDQGYGTKPIPIDLSKRYAVVKMPEDHGDIGQAIYDELALRGMNVQLSNEPENLHDFDILIRYEASWRWDVTWYLLALSVNVYESRNDALIAASARYRTSLVRSSPGKAANALLDELFGAREASRDDE